MGNLWVDTRWSGSHGIGRYAYEVLKRLPFEYESVRAVGAPSDPFDRWRKLSIAAQSSDLFYNPGYNPVRIKIPQVLTVHDLIHLGDGGLRGAAHRQYYQRVVRPAILRARVVITVSETSQEDISHWIDDASVSVVNAGNGCSAEFTAVGDRYQRSRPYVVFVGNLKPHKNVDTLLRAIAYLPDVDLVAVTGAQHLLRERASQAGVGSQTECVGNISDQQLATIYRGAIATIVPSIEEGFGLPAAESLACGTPVVYWEGCRSVREIVDGCGISVQDAYDARQWAECIDHIAHESTPIAANWRNVYSWDTVADRVARVLESVPSVRLLRGESRDDDA